MGLPAVIVPLDASRCVSESMTRLILWLAIITGMLALVYAGMLAYPRFTMAKPDAEPSKMDALRVCQKLVRARLAMPATAEFQADDKTQTAAAERQYAVRGWVEADNGSGIPIRQTYGCNLRWNPKYPDPWIQDVVTITTI